MSGNTISRINAYHEEPPFLRYGEIGASAAFGF